MRDHFTLSIAVVATFGGFQAFKTDLGSMAKSSNKTYHMHNTKVTLSLAPLEVHQNYHGYIVAKALCKNCSTYCDLCYTRYIS